MLKPDVCLTSILEIDINILKKMEVIAIILDVDNTIRFPKKGKLLEGVLCWVKNLKKFGPLLIIINVLGWMISFIFRNLKEDKKLF